MANKPKPLINYCFPSQYVVGTLYNLSTNRVNTGRWTFDYCYDLETVFYKENYSNSKDFYKKVTRHQKYISENELTMREIKETEDIDKVWDLYRSWRKTKLELDAQNPNHFEEHKNLYEACIEESLNKQFAGSMYVIGLFNKDTLLAFQAIYQNYDWVYALANVSDRQAYKEIAEVSFVAFMSYYRDVLKAKFFNFGESAGDPGLSVFKGKWSYFPIYYGKLPEVSFRRTTEQDIDEVKALMQAASKKGTEIDFPTNYMDSSIKSGKVLVALNEKQEIVAMLECRSVDEKKLMTNLITRADSQNQGLGKKILAKLAEEEGSFEFFCVKSNHKAIEFYENIPNVSTYGDYIDRRGIVDTTKVGYRYEI